METSWKPSYQLSAFSCQLSALSHQWMVVGAWIAALSFHPALHHRLLKADR